MRRIGIARWLRFTGVGGVIALLVIGLLPGLAPAMPAPTRASPAVEGVANILSVYQTPSYITEQDTFTIHLEVADASHVTQIWFTFCQLTSALCYLPIGMTQQGSSNWFSGTTNPMTQYSGMKVGVVAGYNITVVYSDGTNATEPVLPNHFSNLTLNQSVTGENMFEMKVGNQLYSLSGKVTDKATGHALVGATVTLHPGTYPNATTDASGGYSFQNVANGSYTVSVRESGYNESNLSVSVAGTNTTDDVPLVNSSIGTPHTVPPSSGGGGSFLTSTIGRTTIAIAVVTVGIVAGVGRMLMLRRRMNPPG